MHRRWGGSWLGDRLRGTLAPTRSIGRGGGKSLGRFPSQMHAVQYRWYKQSEAAGGVICLLDQKGNENPGDLGTMIWWAGDLWMQQLPLL
jgi:hypothetical protein